MTGSSHQTSSSNWRQIVMSLYPDTLTQTYCVPPVHFNRVPYVRDTVPGTGHSALVLPPPSGASPIHIVLTPSQQPTAAFPPSRYSLWTQESQPQAVPVNVQESDCRDDFAQNHVMVNLQELGKSRQEAMFTLSQLSFGNYLNQPAYAAAAAQFPRASQLDTKKTKYSDGEADFVLIHRQHGILIGELKSVGRNQAALNKTQAQADADVTKKVNQAVKQLDRSETVVRHLVSDVAPGLTVRKTLFLPYVRRAQLQRVLDNDPQLEQAVCRRLGAANTAEAVQLCCCSDQLSQPASYWDVTPAVLSQLSTWWQHRMACTVDTLLTDDLYLDIAARFVGPATTVSIPCYNGVRVEVRTAGQAVAELGRRLALLVLTLQQLDLMNRDPPLVCITGPPGTGKTVVLVLQGLRWLLQGFDVHVVSSRFKSRAVSKMILEQLQMSLRADPTLSQTAGAVFYHEYDFYNSETEGWRAVIDLAARVKDDRICILLDETIFENRFNESLPHRLLVSKLKLQIPDLRFWTACVEHTDIPQELQTEVFTVPLRCAPCILRELQPVLAKETGRVHSYCNRGVSSPGDGLRVIRLSHKGNAHRGRWPVDCVKCGLDIAAELRRLGVGTTGSGCANSPAPLRFHDVFVLTRSTDLQDDVTDHAGNILEPASGVVLGLRAGDMQVCVLAPKDVTVDRSKWLTVVHDIATAAHDSITASFYGAVPGLERRVVVILPGRMDGADDGVSDEDLARLDVLEAVSRCTTQLIMVDLPPPPAPTSHNNKTGNDNHPNASGRDKSRKGNGGQEKVMSGTTDASWVKKKGFLL